MESADDAAVRLGKRCAEVALALIRQQAAHFHHFVGKNDVGGITAHAGVGVAERVGKPLVVQSGLDAEHLTGVKLVRPLAADLDQFATELVTEDDGTLRNVLGDALVLAALDQCFVGRHTQTVGDDKGEYFIILEFREVEFLHAQIVFSI